MIADQTHAIQIRERITGRQNQALLGDSVDGDAACRRIVDIGHRTGRTAGKTVDVAMPIGIGGIDTDFLAHQSLREHQGICGLPGNGGTVGQPLQLDGAIAYAIIVIEGLLRQ